MKIKKSDAILIFIIFVATRCLFLMAAHVANTDGLRIWDFYDAHHYQAIADNGYAEFMNTAFFPLFPLVIRFFGEIPAIVINNLAFLISAYLIFDLADQKLSSVILYCLSPISFFSMLKYTEALFMLFTVLAYYLFHKRKFGMVLGISIGCAVATRNVGSMLFFAIFIGMCVLWKKKEISVFDIIKTYVPATIISCLYPLYLHINFGNWKLFVDVQFEMWNRVPTNPIRLFLTQIDTVFNPNHYDSLKTQLVESQYPIIDIYRFNEVVTWIIGLMVIGAMIFMIKKNAKDVNMLVMVSYVILSMYCFNTTIRCDCCNAPTASYFRYYLSLFPIYLSISKLKHDSQIMTIAIASTFTCGVIICFVGHIWFY